ncbi:hypothetical protein ES288_D01G051200v1, partial [Gossypium darwinii]
MQVLSVNFWSSLISLFLPFIDLVTCIMVLFRYLSFLSSLFYLDNSHNSKLYLKSIFLFAHYFFFEVQKLQPSPVASPCSSSSFPLRPACNRVRYISLSNHTIQVGGKSFSIIRLGTK